MFKQAFIVKEIPAIVMGSLLLNHIKKQASSFLQEKYKNARLAFTDVTEAEL